MGGRREREKARLGVDTSGRTTVTRNEVHGGEETRRGVTEGSGEVRDGVPPSRGLLAV